MRSAAARVINLPLPAVAVLALSLLLVGFVAGYTWALYVRRRRCVRRLLAEAEGARSVHPVDTRQLTL